MRLSQTFAVDRRSSGAGDRARPRDGSSHRPSCSPTKERGWQSSICIASRWTKSSSRINEAHGPDTAIGVVADISDLGALAQVVDGVVAQLGGLDILVNNAGVSVATSAFQDYDEFSTNWERTLAVNLTAQAHLIRLVVPFLLDAGGGRIVNIASTEAIVTTAGLAAYAASKAGVVGLTKSFAVELGRHGVTVNCICPGPIDTDMTALISDADKETYAGARVPLRRYGERGGGGAHDAEPLPAGVELRERRHHPGRRWNVDPTHLRSNHPRKGGANSPVRTRRLVLTRLVQEDA